LAATNTGVPSSLKAARRSIAIGRHDHSIDFGIAIARIRVQSATSRDFVGDGPRARSPPSNNWETTMIRRSLLNISALAALGLVMSLDGASAQTKSLKDLLVGTWTLVSEVDTQSDGKKVDGFGANPLGVYMFDANGHFAQMLMRSDLPKYPDRMKGTPEQEKAVAQGAVAYYGTYTVNEADKVVNVHIMGGSFAKFNGTDGKRLIASLTADELKFTNPATSVGGSADTVWKRAK
jgi:hypothetical protein